MSISSQIATVPTTAWPLTLGLLSTSPLLFGNIGLSICGPMPIITEKIAPSELSKKDKLRIWTLFFNQASPYIVSGTVLAATTHAIAAYTAPTDLIRNLSITSALGSIGILPYTLAFIMPTNERLLELDAKATLTTQEEAESTALIKKWDARHKKKTWTLGAASTPWKAGKVYGISTGGE
ncbi:hypothetical protein FKW77_008746 [Venturia effusa]|uniref:DUF1772 domain-containing protein n=1 Tax=Venturia effusa TaxID=50376 RepID=A0A517L1V3_9PEZI|nr:hypothetical protein FKW77_008746 [Venturia effusa]